MAKLLKKPESSWYSQEIVINGNPLTVEYKYNVRSESWYLDILLPTQEYLVSGIKVVPSINLTKQYSHLPELSYGGLYCLRQKNDFSPIDDENLGSDLLYTLVWLSPEEIESLGL